MKTQHVLAVTAAAAVTLVIVWSMEMTRQHFRPKFRVVKHEMLSQ